MTAFDGIHTDFNKSVDQKQLQGNFTVNLNTGEVHITVEDKNATWADVRKAYEAIAYEFLTQVKDRNKCPFSDGS